MIKHHETILNLKSKVLQMRVSSNICYMLMSLKFFQQVMATHQHPQHAAIRSATAPCCAMVPCTGCCWFWLPKPNWSMSRSNCTNHWNFMDSTWNWWWNLHHSWPKWLCFMFCFLLLHPIMALKHGHLAMRLVVPEATRRTFLVDVSGSPLETSQNVRIFPEKIFHCAIIVPSLCHHCAIIVPSLCHHCAIIVPSLCHHCAIIVPSLCHESENVKGVWRDASANFGWPGLVLLSGVRNWMRRHWRRLGEWCNDASRAHFQNPDRNYDELLCGRMTRNIVEIAVLKWLKLLGWSKPVASGVVTKNFRGLCPANEGVTSGFHWNIAFWRWIVSKKGTGF